ncbi:hypothetical protein FACS189444_5060 [Spirochaetia bacterium]|nr:hypothetical protein FACS189444_5060 [Spirochaetia bacterium]
MKEHRAAAPYPTALKLVRKSRPGEPRKPCRRRSETEKLIRGHLAALNLPALYIKVGLQVDLLESLRIPELAAKLDTAADPLAGIADIIDIPDFDLSGLDL